jgi:hypothetical protein
VVYAQLTGAIVQAALGAANMLFWRVLVDDGYALAGLALIYLLLRLRRAAFLAAGSGLWPAFAMK